MLVVRCEVKAQTQSSLPIDNSVGELEAKFMNTIITKFLFGAALFVTMYGVLGDECFF